MATPANMPISLRLNRDFVLSVTELTDEGNPWDLRGMKIAMVIKGNITDPDSRALYLSEHFYTSDLAFGKYSFLVSVSGSGWASTASADYEIVYEDPTGVTQTRLEGPVAIGPSVLVIVP
jgi:hypothetical protein